MPLIPAAQAAPIEGIAGLANRRFPHFQRKHALSFARFGSLVRY
jgi:hypothetical protein